MRAARRRAAAVALAGILAIGALGSGLFANLARASALSRSAHSNLPRTARSNAGLAVLVTTRTVIPKIQRTIGFTGYATYTFAAPKGRRIVSASARIVGAVAHAVTIRSRTITHNRTRYTVRLVFPGEQGDPGKLLVRLATVG